MNNKNQLQTYCQRRGIALPIYNSVQDQSNNTWLSTVEVDGVSYTGLAQPKKVAADISAATKALETINTMHGIHGIHAAVTGISSDTIVPVRRYKQDELMIPFFVNDPEPVCVLIDYENVNKLEHLHNTYMKRNNIPAYVCKFVGYCNQKASTDECTHVIQTASPDGVDHYISFYLGMLYNAMKYMKPWTCIILTRDKFGAHHANFSKCIHVATEADCIKILEGKGYVKTNERKSYKDWGVHDP